MGQVWLALSILAWSFSGAVEVYFVNASVGNTLLLDGWRSIFSLFNSLFILLALPWFRYLPKPIAPVIKSKYWIYIVGLPFVFSLLPTINKMISGKGGAIVNELDVYYAVLTLLFLGLVLWESFAKRRLKGLAYLSLVCVMITLLAQFYKLTGSYINLTLFSAIFKTTLIMIFFALALSWVKELAENVIPEANKLWLAFDKERLKGKTHQFVLVRGLPGENPRKISLSPGNYDLFLKFAKLRLEQKDDWLEIKPKNHSFSGKQFDINDYNEIKRLLSSLLDGLFGKENWTKNHHFVPLKNTLFEQSEKRSRKIRLAIPPENITLP